MQIPEHTEMVPTKETEKSAWTNELAEAIDGLGLPLGAIAQAIANLSTELENAVHKLGELSDKIAGLESLREPPPPQSVQRVSLGKSRSARPVSFAAHGGSRTASVSKGVDDLIASGWLVRKSQDEIVSKLEERFPGANPDNVLHVLKRRLNKTLVRSKRGGDWVWSPIEAK